MKTLIDDVELTSYASSLKGNIGSPHAYIIHFKGSPESYDDEYITVNSLSVVVKSNVYLNKVEVYVECPDSKKYANFAVTIFSPVTEKYKQLYAIYNAKSISNIEKMPIIV